MKTFVFASVSMALTLTVFLSVLYVSAVSVNWVVDYLSIPRFVHTIVFFVFLFTVVMDTTLFISLNAIRYINKLIKYETDIEPFRYQSAIYQIIKSYRQA